MASVQDLSSRYGTQLRQLKSIFPSWDEGDLAFTLQDTKGNVDEAAMMITEGRASQFTEATTKKKAPKAPSKDTTSKHSNRNADTGGWENSNGEGFAGRGGRGGARGGRGGGRGGRGGEPTRGGRGGRGGIRGGRGGYAGINGTPKTATETTDTTTDGWAAAVEEATSGQNGEEASAESSTQAAAAGKGDDFAAAGGWGDAPSASEISKAAKSGNSGWQGKGKQAVSQINTAAPAPTGPPKLTWAQIAKPAEKPKPVPAPEPEVAEPATTEETPAPEAEQEEAAAEPIESFGDAPAASEVEEQAAALPETEAEPETTAPQSDDLLPEEAQEEEWQDPAIAGSGGTGDAPEWVKDTQEQTKVDAPEPVTTYTGPPGFNSPTASKGPVAQVQAQAPPAQPRSNSRAAQRYKNADGKGVVLPSAVNSNLSGVNIQFGSLDLAGEKGDNSDAAPTFDQASPVQPITQALSAVSPPATKDRIASPQFPTNVDEYPAHIQQLIAQHAQQHGLQHTQQSQAQQQTQQQSQQQYQQSQSQQPQQAQQSQQVPPHVTLQQQATNFNQYQQHQQHQPQQQQQQHNDPAVSQSQFYRQGGNDFYGSQSQEPAQQSQAQQPSSASAYDSAFGGFGQQSQQQLYGQGQQQQHHQQASQANDAYSGRQAYDSYAASGYPRPAEEQKPAAPAPAHTPTAPGQQQPQQGLHQQNQYFQGGNMPYYQNAYNPYYQYGQAPQPGFQPYYPLAGRNLYGQPTPPAAPAQIPQSKPAQTQSPYGGPQTQQYPSSGYDDQTSFGSAGGGGRFGDSKAPSSAQSNQYSHGGYLGVGQQNAQSARQQAATPDDGFKSTTPQSSVGASANAQGTQGQQAQQGQAGQGLRGPQGFGAAAGAGAGAGGYPYGGYQAQGQQDWSQYGQQYGGSRNGGYSGWAQ